jgi:nicotinate phosphoribosyltransferase
MVSAAKGRSLLEFGSRRTHEEAAVAAARAAYVAGFDATSNLAAGRAFGVPTAGTSAHAFTLVHDNEASAFAAQVASLGVGTTLLIDTYDERKAIVSAIDVAGTGLGSVRIDSGDLGEVARTVRSELDARGATDTRIVASSDLDEYRLQELADAPIDAYGIGTQLVIGSGEPTAGFVYKLVARENADGELDPVAKTSHEKATTGGRKHAARHCRRGIARAERLSTKRQPRGRQLQVPLVADGEILPQSSLAAAREHHRTAIAELPEEAFLLEDGPPAIPTIQEGQGAH